MHHSSLSAGEPVLMAGELKISGGKLAMITNKSGHFRPDPDAFKQFLGDLERQHVALQGVHAPAFRGFTPTEANENVLNTGTLGVQGRSMLGNIQAPPSANASAAPVSHPVPELQTPQNAGPTVVQPPRPAVQPPPAPGAGARPRIVPPASTGPRPTAPAEDDNYQSEDPPRARVQSPANGASTTARWLTAPAESVWQRAA